MWIWTGILLVLLAIAGLVTFDLLAHYWAGRFHTWADLRNHLLYLAGIRKHDRPWHAVRGRGRPALAKRLTVDRRAAGSEQEHR